MVSFNYFNVKKQLILYLHNLHSDESSSKATKRKLIQDIKNDNHEQT